MRDFERMEIETESSLPLDQTVDLIRKFGSYLVTSGRSGRRWRHLRPVGDPKNQGPAYPLFPTGLATNPVYWIELTEQPTVRKPQGYFSNVFGLTGKQ